MADPAVENAVAKQVLEKMETIEVSKQLLAEIIDRTQAAKVPAGWSLDGPMTFDEQLKAADMVSKTEFCPKDYRGKPENVMVAAHYGRDLGLKFLQSLWGIAVINGRPSVWGDAALAVVLASGLVEDFKELCGSDALAAGSGFCQIKRKGRASWVQVKFTREDAEIAGLWGKAGPWQNYPGRMLQMRARGFALRDAFADVLKGLPFVEETSDYQSGLFGGRPIIDTQGTVKAPESKSAQAAMAALPQPAATPPSVPPPPAPVQPTGVGKPKPTAPGGNKVAQPWQGKLKVVESLTYDDKNQKTGVVTKKPWYHLVGVDGTGFATYSESAANLARETVGKGSEVVITWENTGKPNLRVKTLDPVLPGDAKKADAKPAPAPAPEDSAPIDEPPVDEPGSNG